MLGFCEEADMGDGLFEVLWHEINIDMTLRKIFPDVILSNVAEIQDAGKLC